MRRRMAIRRSLREVHLLQEGLEAGVGAEGVEVWKSQAPQLRMAFIVGLLYFGHRLVSLS